ncbi:MAG: T9SS type A sorting domain-containing protein, partial [Bacteroidales bacterium]|nr:T9SS type A sorting domain-containing protein [Bacteroidales bacterium]
WDKEGEFIQAIDFNVSGSTKNSSVLANNQGNLLYSVNTTASISFANGVSAYCPAGQSSAVFALYHDPEFAQPYVGIPEYDGPEPEVRLWPNPATDKITIESEEEFPVKSVSIADMQGQLLAILPVNDVRCTLNVHKLAPGTYIAHVETKAGVVDRKFVVGR